MRSVFPFVLGLVLADPPVAAPAQAITHGIVFVDKNGDGIHQPNEPGLAGVVVSNQDAVVVTDKSGGFDLGPGPNGLIFVSEPDGYRSVGSFWQILDRSGQPMSLALKKVVAPSTFTFVDASDTHLAPASLPQTQRFRAVVDSLRPDFVLVVGDLVRDALRVPETEARSYYDMLVREFGAFKVPMHLVPGNHENFGIETALSHVDPANPLFGRAMYHHYFGPDYYSFTRGGVHFVGLNSVDISGTSYYGHVDSVQLAWLARDLSHVPATMPVVTFNHIPLISSHEGFGGYDDGPPAPTLITVKGVTSFRHVVSNASDVLTVLRAHRHVLAIGAHIHAGERITYITDGLQTRFEQSPAIVGPSGIPPFTFPAGLILYRVHGGQIDSGKFIPVSPPRAAAR
jgi:3',5'-cyclic AMP phosphodiesterase CpdA